MKFRLMAALLAGTSIFAAQAHAEPVKIGIANFGPHPVLDSVIYCRKLWQKFKPVNQNWS